jgi:hypothetical protein
LQPGRHGAPEGDVMTRRLATEIITIHSLKALVAQIDEEISSYLSQKEEYSEKLGDFLREAAEKYGEEGRFKELSLDNLPKGKTKPKKGKKKKGKAGEAEDWIQFRSMLLSSSIQGEAEIMFDAIQAITRKLDELAEAKEAVEELRNIGLGNNVEYICLIRDGVVSKIVLKSVDEESAKFAFNRGFTVIRAIQP